MLGIFKIPQHNIKSFKNSININTLFIFILSMGKKNINTKADNTIHNFIYTDNNLITEENENNLASKLQIT
jgi:hypothetical protein